MKSDWEVAQEKYWSNLSIKYDSLYTSTWSSFEDRQLQEWITQLCAGKTGQLLDLGCGTGLGYKLLRQAAPHIEYEGVDISGEMLDKMRTNFPKARTRKLSIDDLGNIRPSSYHFVLALNSAMSFASDTDLAFKNVFRILDHGGVAFLSFLSRYSLRRLLSLRVGAVENFSTRNSSSALGSVPANTMTPAALKSAAVQCGFINVSVLSQGVLAGVVERTFVLPLERRLVRLCPALAHCQYLVAKKA